MQMAAAQQSGVKVGVLQFADANGDIGFMFQQIDDVVVRGDVQMDLRVSLCEIGNKRRNLMENKRTGGVHSKATGRRLFQ